MLPGTTKSQAAAGAVDMEGVATGIGRCSIVAKVALEPEQRIYAGICGRCDVPDNRDDGEHLDAQISSRRLRRRVRGGAAPTIAEPRSYGPVYGPVATPEPHATVPPACSVPASLRATADLGRSPAAAALLARRRCSRSSNRNGVVRLGCCFGRRCCRRVVLCSGSGRWRLVGLRGR